MELKTNYDIGQTAFIINMNIQEVEIKSVSTNNYVSSNGQQINKVEYKIIVRSSKSERTCQEENVYASKFEAAKSWLTKQNLEPNDVIQSVFAAKKAL